jgi:O-antigen ligase
MPENIRALIVVCVLGAAAFYVAQQISRSVLPDREFVLLRNSWFAMSVAAFLSPGFVAFSMLALMICIYVYSVRSAVVPAFFVLLFAVPLVGVEIGGFGLVNKLMDINNGRILCIVLLLPALIIPDRSREPRGRFALPDLVVVIYVLLVTALQLRSTEFTNALRVATVSILDILLPYLAFSRAVTSTADIRKVFFCFVIAVLPLSLIAVFELLKKWRLYSSSGEQLAGIPLGYLTREGALRATGPALSPIVFGTIFMVAIGCLLAVWQSIRLRQYARGVMAMLLAALVATLSRGPWVGTAILFITYLVNGRGAFKKITFVAFAAVLGLGVLLTLPGGERVLDFLPFVGKVEADTVDYRKRLFEQALIVIGDNPWLGSVDYRTAPEMEELLQGESQIDIVNHYLKVALDSGFIGLGIFLFFFVGILFALWRTIKRTMVSDPELNTYARTATAILVALLAVLATASSIDFIPYIYWSFAGLCVAIVRVSRRESLAWAHGAQFHRIPG